MVIHISGITQEDLANQVIINVDSCETFSTIWVGDWNTSDPQAK